MILKYVMIMFVEININSTNNKCNIIVGCIYQPICVKIADIITVLSIKHDKLKRENKYTFLP